MVTAKDSTGTVIPLSALRLHFDVSDPSFGTINAKTGVLTALVPGTVIITASTTYYGITQTDTLQYTIGYPDVTVVTSLLSQRVDGSYQSYFQRANILVGVHKTVLFEIPYLIGNAFSWNPANFVGAAPLVNAGLSVVFDDPTAAQPSPLDAATLAGRYASNGSGNITLTVPDSLFADDSVPENAQSLHIYPRLNTYCQSTPYPCAAARSFSTPGTYHYQSLGTGATGTITVLGP
jgi:hypothetical protein